MSHKKPRHLFQPRTAKIPRTVEDPTAQRKENRKEKLRWSFEIFDNGKEWHDDQYSPIFNEIAGHLKSFEQRTWGEIEADRKYYHAVPVVNLIPDAQSRLTLLKLDENDPLTRLRFTGRQRAWGFRRGHLFMLVWWDPQHRICPSRLKNT